MSCMLHENNLKGMNLNLHELQGLHGENLFHCRTLQKYPPAGPELSEMLLR
jgi:hypothetical protein